MKLLSDAGVGALTLDASNGEIYEDIYRQLLTVMEQIHKEGGRPPKFFFFAPRVVVKASTELLEKFYKPGHFRDIWFMWDGKPLLMGTADPDPEVKKFFTIREAAWPGKPPYKNTPFAWHWQSVYPQTYGFTEDPNVAEQMNVSPAQNAHWQTGALKNFGRQDDALIGNLFAARIGRRSTLRQLCRPCRSPQRSASHPGRVKRSCPRRGMCPRAPDG